MEDEDEGVDVFEVAEEEGYEGGEEEGVGWSGGEGVGLEEAFECHILKVEGVSRGRQESTYKV